MSSIKEKIIKNLREGTFLKNGYLFIERRVRSKIKHNNLFISRDPYRMRLKDIYDTLRPIDTSHEKLGNYFADISVPLNKNSIVYSLGVGNHIDFDLAVSEKYGCPVYMYDPTPLSIEFMKKYEDKALLRFYPYGVWTEATTLTFFTPKHGGSSSALNNAVNASDSFTATCNTLSFFMKENGHEKIDFLKMDIEGAALPIMEDLLKNGPLPAQVIAEFETPSERTEEKQDDYLGRLQLLIEAARAAGYEIYKTPYSGARYFSIELLFVRKNKGL